VAKVDFVLVAEEPKLIEKIKSICSEFSFSYLVANNVDDVVEKFADDPAQFVVISTGLSENKDLISGQVQVVRQVFPESYIFVAVGKKMDPKAADWIKKSGANTVVLEEELLTSSKLDFVSLQCLKASYMPIKGADIKEGTRVEFPIFHLLAANKKFLPVVHKGMTIDASRVKKLRDVVEVYVKRNDISLYREYLNANQDLSASGLISRCRAQYLNLSVAYADMAITLTNQTESSSFQEGRLMLEKIQTMASDLLNSLMAAGNVWDIVNNSVIGDFGSVERSPAIAAYSGFIAMMTGIVSPETIMLASLVQRLGLLSCRGEVTQKMRRKREQELTELEKTDYQQYPIRSINVVLNKKIQLPEEVKSAIQFCHSNLDMTGFPQIAAVKIPRAAQILHFCNILDERVQVNLGKVKPDFKTEYYKLVNEEAASKIINFADLLILKKIEL
jgi:hypothetical protein